MNKPIDEEKLSVTGLLREIYKSKITVLIFTACFLVLGLIIYFMSPKEYAYRTVLLPESSGNSIGLGAIANLAGINLGRSDSRERTLNPMVYEPVLRSSPFLDRIVKKEFYFPTIDKTVSLSVYLNRYTEKPVGEKISGLFSFGSSAPAKPTQVAAQPEVVTSQTDSIPLTKGDSIARIFDNTIIAVSSRSAIKKLNDRLEYAQDMQNGLITLSFDLQDPVAGAKILQTIVNEFILITKSYEGQKQDVSLEQLDAQIIQRKKEYDAALNRLAAFNDRNINVIRQSVEVEETRLQNAVALAQNIYNSLLQQRESLNIQSNTAKAPIAVIEPPQEASSPYRPKLVLTLIISIFLGVLVGSLFVLSRRSIVKIVD